MRRPQPNSIKQFDTKKYSKTQNSAKRFILKNDEKLHI